MIVHPPDVELLLEELAVTPDAAGQCSVLFRLVHRVWVYDLDAALEFANHARTIADSTGLAREAALARLERGRIDAQGRRPFWTYVHVPAGSPVDQTDTVTAIQR